MRKLLVLAALCLCAAGAGFARELIVVSAPAAEGEAQVIGVITLRYLDPAAVAVLLGGTAVDLTPAPRPRQAQRYAAYEYGGGGTWPGGAPAPQPSQPGVSGGYPAAQQGLNPHAPLFPFVPAGIDQIIGIQR